MTESKAFWLAGAKTKIGGEDKMEEHKLSSCGDRNIVNLNFGWLYGYIVLSPVNQMLKWAYYFVSKL